MKILRHVCISIIALPKKIITLSQLYSLWGLHWNISISRNGVEIQMKVAEERCSRVLFCKSPASFQSDVSRKINKDILQSHRTITPLSNYQLLGRRAGHLGTEEVCFKFLIAIQQPLMIRPKARGFARRRITFAFYALFELYCDAR